MRFGILTALAAMALVAIFAFGCSDDKTTSSTPVNYADLEDPQFAPVKTPVDETVNNLLDDVLSGFENKYVTPGDTVSVRADLMPPLLNPPLGVGPDTLIADYQEGWHYVYASYTGDMYKSRLWDSVQIQVDGTPVETPIPAVDYIHGIRRWSIMPLNPGETHFALYGRNDFELANLDQSVATINGSRANAVELEYIAADTSLIDNYNFDMTITNLQLAKTLAGWTSACPQTGTIDMNLSRVVIWQGPHGSGNGSGSWHVTITFDDGSATVTASNGDNRWRYTTQICTIPTP